MFHRDFMVPSGSGSGSGACLPSFLSFLFSGMGCPMNSLLHMNLVETWFVAVWGLCWCNFVSSRSRNSPPFEKQTCQALFLLASMDGESLGHRGELLEMKHLVPRCSSRKEHHRFLQCNLTKFKGVESGKPMVPLTEALSACEKGGEWLPVLQLLEQMVDESVERSTIAYCAAISACEKAKSERVNGLKPLNMLGVYDS